MSNLQITGTITKIGEPVEGVAKSSGNPWKKIGFVINTGGDYPKNVYFVVFGVEKVDNFIKFNKVGQNVDVSFNAESREYKGQHYTELNAWKVFTNTGVEQEVNVAETENDQFASADDLPF